MKVRDRTKIVWMFVVALIVSLMVTAPGLSNPELLLYVDPPLSSVPPTETFDIYVTAGTEVEPVVDLFLAEFTLSWDPPLLYTDVDSINLGDVAPFLDFVYIEQVNNDEGWLKVTMGRPIGVKDGMTGAVQIAKITFLVEAEGSCALQLSETRLKDVSGTDLVHVTEDGRFEYPIAPLPGFIEGTVTDDAMVPLVGATVSTDAVSDVTDALGFYSLEVSAGTYDVTAEMTGYVSETVTGVVVVADTITTQDFALTPIPVGTVDSLIDLVEEFYNLGYIDSEEIKDSLLNKLYAAKAKIDRSQVKTAKNILGAFINHLQAQHGKHITSAAAEILISEAENIISNL